MGAAVGNSRSPETEDPDVGRPWAGRGTGTLGANPCRFEPLSHRGRTLGAIGPVPERGRSFPVTWTQLLGPSPKGLAIFFFFK